MRIITFLLLIFTCFTGHANDLKFSGFIDFQYRWIDKDTNYKTGFQLYDAAIYFQHNLTTQTLFFVDVPIRSTAPEDINGDGRLQATNDFEFWKNKSQMYLSHQLNHNTIYLGQFDSVLGVEANDTLHNPLPIEGLMSQVFPSVHRGLMLNHELRFLATSFDFIVGNQESSGYDQKKPLEWGVNMFKKWEHIHASIAYLYSRDTGKNNEIINLVTTLFFNQIKIDLEYGWIKKAINPKQTVGGSLRMTMPVNESLSYHLLIEQADEINSLSRQKLFVLSGSKSLLTVLKLKIGVGLLQTWKASYDDKLSDQIMFTSSAIYSF